MSVFPKPDRVPPRPVSADPTGRDEAGRRGTRFGGDSPPRFGLGRLAGDQRGLAVIEYALLCALLVLALVAGIGNLGESSEKNWSEVAEALPGDDGSGKGDNGKGKDKEKDKKDK